MIEELKAGIAPLEDANERLSAELSAMIEPIEIRDTARADFWAACALARLNEAQSIATDMKVADELLAEYDKRFTDPDAPLVSVCSVCDEDDPRYVDFLFDGPPGPDSPGLIDVTNQNGGEVSVGEWLEVSPGDWVLRVTPKALRACL